MKLHQWQGRRNEFSLVDDTKAKKYALKYISKSNFILDIGCGDCIFFDIVNRCREDCKLYGFDIIKESLAICKKKGYIPVSSLDKLKLKFDVITMFECFEHLDYKDKIKQVRIINSLLKARGFVILSFPNIMSILSLIHYSDNPEHKFPYPLEGSLLKFFNNYEIISKVYFNPWLNPIKIIQCLITGFSFKAIYNNVCYVLRKK